MQTAAVEKLYKSYAGDIYRYSMYKLHDKTDAEDVVAEVFTRFMEKAEAGEIENMKLWLLGFARNIIYSKYQKEKKLADIDVDRWLQSVPDDDAPNVDAVASEELITDVQAAMHTLDTAEQEVVTLKIWEELKFSEIAKLVNQKENTVKAIYYRSLDKMKRKLEKNYKQLNVITLPLLVAAIAKLKLDIAIPTTLSNLVNLQTMENTLPESVTPTQTSNSGLKSLLQTTKGKIIAGVVAVALLTSVAGTAVYLSSQNSDDAIVTPVVTPTIDTWEPIVDDYAGWELYSNTRYGFSMKHPSDWDVSEEAIASCNMSNAPAQNGGPCQLVKFQKGDTELLVAVTSLTENGQIGITGLGAGEIEERGATIFNAQSLRMSILTFEGKTKQMLFNGGSAFTEGENKFFIDLSSTATGEYSNVELSAEDQRTAILIVTSYAAIAADSSTNTLVEFAHADLPGFSFEYDESWAVTIKELGGTTANDFDPEYQDRCLDDCMGVRLSKNNIDLYMIFEPIMDDHGLRCSNKSSVSYLGLGDGWYRVRDERRRYYSPYIATNKSFETDTIYYNRDGWETIVVNVNYKICDALTGSTLKERHPDYKDQVILVEHQVVKGNPTSEELKELDAIITSIQGVHKVLNDW